MTKTLDKILCVEDETDIQTVAKLALETVGGFTVEMCGSGEEALEKAPNFSPDLILLDVMMPGMDGLDTFRAVRALPQAEETPIIFMTAKSQAHEVSQLMELGAAGVISKPFDPIELSRQLTELWEKSN
jgi:two-component system OmpR family response regulator